MTAGQPHLEALHDVCNVPFDETLDVRQNKEHILDAYGFSKGAHPPDVKHFTAGTQGTPVRSYLAEQLSQGSYTALVFKSGHHETMGGLHVTYLMRKADLEERLVFGDTGCIVGAQADGRWTSPAANTPVTAYTRPHSLSAQLEGFDNYEATQDVTLGGGFRLQVDHVTYEHSRPQMVLSAHVSFNDYGSRVLAQENEEHRAVPLASKSVQVPIADDNLVFPNKVPAVSEVRTTSDAIDVVLSELFTRDGAAVNGIIRDLLTVRPAMGVHQLEGIYGVRADGSVSAEVFDFDGIDIFDTRATADRPDPIERLAGGQLLQAGFLQYLDDGNRVMYHRQAAEFRQSLAELPETVSDEVRDLATLRPGEDITRYAKRLEHHGRLARTLDYCGLEWQETSSPYVRQSHRDRWLLTRVEAAGFAAVFAEREGAVVSARHAKELYTLARQIVGSNLLRLYVSLSREGD